MAKAKLASAKAASAKLALHASRDIPLDQLVLSQANVRRVKAGHSIDMLAADIERRGLLQSLSVRPVLNADGKDTGIFEVPAGGRRFKALQLLVKQKKLAKTAAIPCIVKSDGLAEEDSLAENVHREALHPLDQFRAFQTLSDAGQGLEEIAATFGVTPAVVRQRLKLAAASPKLLDAYVAEELSLDQLMAFCVTGNHQRQDEVWDRLLQSYNREPYLIRRMLTESAVRSDDRRARFVGIEAYEDAGGVVMRDLFSSDGGGWFADAALLDRLTLDKLQARAGEIKGEGWNWAECAIDFPWGQRHRYRQLEGQEHPLSNGEQSECDALRAEYEQIQEAHDSADELPEAQAQRLEELEAALARFDELPLIYDQTEMAYAGIIVSLSHDGRLRIDRGLVRSEDDPQRRGESSLTQGYTGSVEGTAAHAVSSNGADHGDQTEGDAAGPASISDRLLEELTASRTAAMREALAADPAMAMVSVLHALCLKLFYTPGKSASCLEIEAREVRLERHAQALAALPVHDRFEQRRQHWLARLPADPAELWDMVTALHDFDRANLLALCAALSLNAVYNLHDRRQSGPIHTDQLAVALRLDMTEAGWRATAASYFGHVTKAQILDAVREAKGDAAAGLIAHCKKADMAREAERLLDGSRWLPQALRTGRAGAQAKLLYDLDEDEALPAFLTGGDTGDACPPYAIAAE